ncbi:MAG: M2 family metallopeptidase [Isosphaeraceae bacterium]
MTPRTSGGIRVTAILLLATMSNTSLNGSEPRSADDEARAFVTGHETNIRPLEIAAARAWWNANVSGKDADFAAKEEAQNRLDAALADRAVFARLKTLKESSITDPMLARSIALLYLQYLEKQVDPALLKKITAKANAVEKTFNAYRARVGGKELTDSEVRKVLKSGKDNAERQAVWEASKAVGAAVESDLKQLVALRNEAARALGFPNFHAMMLSLNEQSSDDVLKLFDELDDLTRKPFDALKGKIDAKLASLAGVGVDELRPWHYHDPFFQEVPAVFAADLDAPYTRADILALCRTFYQGIGLPIDDVIARSDLYEKPGKSPHAFCIDINREGDVRVLANIVPTEYWMGTMLHELGHAVYSSKNIPASLPYVLRSEAHILTTEGVAMLFERFSKDAEWLGAMGVKVSDPAAFDEAGAEARRAKLLIFSRWCQVMLRFEKSLYENPAQDLNALWWNLVEKYQGIRRPAGRNAPDYASKIHIVSSPAYYHNYMMGELFAAQVHAAVCREVLQGVDPGRASYVNNPKVGAFIKAKVFEPGRTRSWNDLTRFATGAPLNPSAFASEFQGK